MWFNTDVTVIAITKDLSSTDFILMNVIALVVNQAVPILKATLTAVKTVLETLVLNVGLTSIMLSIKIIMNG